jgi:hypothetical protein
VVDSGAPLGEIACYRGIGIFGLEKLYQRLTGGKASYSRPVRIVESYFAQTQYIPKEGERLRESLDRYPNM